MSHENVLQERPDSLAQECPHSCLTDVKQECLTRVPHKGGCPTRMPHKGRVILQVYLARGSHNTVQESPCKSLLHYFPTGVLEIVTYYHYIHLALIGISSIVIIFITAIAVRRRHHHHRRYLVSFTHYSAFGPPCHD